MQPISRTLEAERVPSPKLVVEFSLALNNRTGKYFAAVDMLAALDGRVRHMNFWRSARTTVPDGLFAKVLGRCLSYEVRARSLSRFFDRACPRLRPKCPVIFTDPREVLLYKLRPSDVVIVHDVGPLTHPQYYALGVESIYNLAYEQICKAKPHVICVSVGTKDEFLRLFGRDFASVRVIYNPTRTKLAVGEQTQPAGIKTPFFLTVGAIGARKNQAGLIKAFSRSGLANDGYQLVLSGGPEPGYDEVVREAQGVPGVVMPGYVRDSELSWLYANAQGFALPSHLEGFGMPVAEALAQDLLPLVSAEGPLAEVAGDAAVHVDPASESSIAAGLVELARLTPAERAARVAQGKASLRRFAPTVVAGEWIAAVNEILVAQVRL